MYKDFFFIAVYAGDFMRNLCWRDFADTRSSTNSVDMVQPEEKRAMLGEITNQASNEQRDARTKRFNILRQKRKFSETNPTPTKPKQLNIEPSFQLSAASESSENHSIIETHSKCIRS